jgi:hypothetical protein
MTSFPERPTVEGSLFTKTDPSTLPCNIRPLLTIAFSSNEGEENKDKDESELLSHCRGRWKFKLK